FGQLGRHVGGLLDVLDYLPCHHLWGLFGGLLRFCGVPFLVLVMLVLGLVPGGTARLGATRLGRARLGAARLGTVRLGAGGRPAPLVPAGLDAACFPRTWPVTGSMRRWSWMTGPEPVSSEAGISASRSRCHPRRRSRPRRPRRHPGWRCCRWPTRTASWPAAPGPA